MADNQVTKVSVKSFLKSEAVQKSIKDTLGAKGQQFTASLLALVGQDELLAQSDPNSLFSAALTAAALDLPINKNLGFAHIIGYRNNKKSIVEAQFQIGWKGFIQLAQRTGQYKMINAVPVYEGQLIKEDRLRGNTYDWDARTSDEVIGYVSILVLVTSFEHELYMSKDEVQKHGKRYSQSFKSGYGPWADNFDAMALKTVIKLNISKYGPMSTELLDAVKFDQAVIKEDGIEYLDNYKLEDEKATDDQKAAILAANGVEDLGAPAVTAKASELYDSKLPKEMSTTEREETVREKAERKYGKPKQESLIEDDNRTSNNPGV